jgi:uncharacterized protein (DUF983 family)
LLDEVRLVVVSGEVDNPGLRECFKATLRLGPRYLILVVVGTMSLPAVCSMQAGIRFIIFGMVLLLLPAVTVLALQKVRTSLRIIVNELF